MNASNVRHINEAPYEATPRSRWGVAVRHLTLTTYADPAGEWAVMAYPGSQYGMVTNHAEFEELKGATHRAAHPIGLTAGAAGRLPAA